MDQGGYAFAYALSNAAGLRPFFTLAVFSWMAGAGAIHSDPHFTWLAYDGVSITLTVLAALEIMGDKVPVLDHAIHAFDFIMKPAVAILLSGAAAHFQSGNPGENAGDVVVMIASAANALGIHAVLTGLRGTSTTFTLGAANPLISFIEDIAGTIAVIIAIFIPLAGAILAIIATIISIWVIFAIRGKWRVERAGP